MTIYDFTTQPNRLAHRAVKYQAPEVKYGVLPLWIADMDFLAFPALVETAQAYVDHHLYGYSYASDSLFERISDWEEKRHHYHYSRESIVLVEGVVPAIGIAIQAFTDKNDGILINTPAYPPFARTIQLNDRKLVTSELLFDEEEGQFLLNFDEIEQLFKNQEVKMFIFCSPQNPGGRVWSAFELNRLGELCQTYSVLLISDEIHQDLVWNGHEHHSFHTISPDFKKFSIVLSSATKTFNIADTKCSFALIEDEVLREAYLKQRLANNQHEINGLGLLMTETAFQEGEQWLEALKPVIEKNIDYIYAELSQKTKIKVMKPQGTYLIWLDFSAYALSDHALHEKLLHEAKVILNEGISFGKGGASHARLNVAAPFSVIQDASQRICDAFKK